MFERFRPFRAVLVTGPQRSGTTICAAMIAHDTGKRFVREDDHFNEMRFMRYYVEFVGNCVIQCPAMAHLAHTFGGRDDVAIVFMLRPTAEIVASQERINWPWEAKELAKYGRRAEPPVAEVKLSYWREYQQPVIRHAFEVAYRDLASHELWVPENVRRANGWGPRQIDVADAL